jgi:hypothetical protein
MRIANDAKQKKKEQDKSRTQHSPGARRLRDWPSSYRRTPTALEVN